MVHMIDKNNQTNIYELINIQIIPLISQITNKIPFLLIFDGEISKFVILPELSIKIINFDKEDRHFDIALLTDVLLPNY